jgi:hypothetical protein
VLTGKQELQLTRHPGKIAKPTAAQESVIQGLRHITGKAEELSYNTGPLT